MMERSVVRPGTSGELSEFIGDAAGDARKLEIRGGGTKASIGGSSRAAQIIDMGGFDNVVDYDPAELVLTVGAGMPLATVQELVARERQMLAFDPFDFGPIFGSAAGRSTIGGVVAAGLAGSRRLSAGSVRDHLLGFEAVSGRGERLVGGAKVVKNVTGYDLSKIMCGSWGRLVALTQVTLKVLPSGREQASCLLEGLSAAIAVQAMAKAMGSQAEVSAAAHLPPRQPGDCSRTVLRVEGFEASVEARCRMLENALREFGPLQTLPAAQADELWADLRTLAPLADHPTLWRINVAPSRGAAVVQALEMHAARWLFDWAGGLIWLSYGHAGLRADELDARANAVRAAATHHGGHALLVRANEELRARVPALQPLDANVAALESRVRRAFDPNGVFESGRFSHAN